MSVFWLMTAISLTSGVVFFSFFTGSYNRLVRLRQHLDGSAAQVSVQLQRRHDLVPHLIEAVRGVLSHERELLETVLRAHAAAQGAAHTNGPASDPAPYPSAEHQLTQALHRLAGVLERTPRVHADAAIARLLEEVTTTENRVAFARQAFNDLAASYNAALHTFPHLLVARLFG